MYSTKGLNFVLFGLFVLFFIEIFIILITPIKQEPELLFDKAGCKTFVFYEKGNRHYYTDCEDHSEKEESGRKSSAISKI